MTKRFHSTSGLAPGSGWFGRLGLRPGGQEAAGVVAVGWEKTEKSPLYSQRPHGSTESYGPRTTRSCTWRSKPSCGSHERVLRIRKINGSPSSSSLRGWPRRRRYASRKPAPHQQWEEEIQSVPSSLLASSRASRSPMASRGIERFASFSSSDFAPRNPCRIWKLRARASHATGCCAGGDRHKVPINGSCQSIQPCVISRKFRTHRESKPCETPSRTWRTNRGCSAKISSFFLVLLCASVTPWRFGRFSVKHEPAFLAIVNDAKTRVKEWAFAK